MSTSTWKRHKFPETRFAVEQIRQHFLNSEFQPDSQTTDRYAQWSWMTISLKPTLLWLKGLHRRKFSDGNLIGTGAFSQPTPAIYCSLIPSQAPSATVRHSPAMSVISGDQRRWLGLAVSSSILRFEVYLDNLHRKSFWFSKGRTFFFDSFVAYL